MYSNHSKGGHIDKQILKVNRSKNKETKQKENTVFQKAILSLKFEFPANNSKQQIQISSSG